jgi:pyruvate dehydrogenase E1 component alpha subunit
MDLRSVFREAGVAVGRARNGDGATLLECKTYRYMGHSRFEKAAYRLEGELEQWRKRDPVQLFAHVLIGEMEVDSEELGRIENEVQREIDDAVEYARSSPDPGAHDYRQYIFS